MLRTFSHGLFPGYLFVSIDMEADRWRSVRSTIGVRELIADSIPVFDGDNTLIFRDETG